jgi:RNA polymerase sigma-70 factor (ECF subfamily)
MSRDVELWQRTQSGDQDAFSELYEKYSSLLYAHAYKMLNSREDAKDIVQDLFFNLWEKRMDLEIRQSLSSYLYTSVRNRILDQMAKEKNRMRFLNSLQSFLDEGVETTEAQVRETELKEIIENEVAQLPEKMRLVFTLSRNEELSHKEIAEALQVSDKTVKKQVSNALSILKKKLEISFPILFLFLHLLP